MWTGHVRQSEFQLTAYVGHTSSSSLFNTRGPFLQCVWILITRSRQKHSARTCVDRPCLQISHHLSKSMYLCQSSYGDLILRCEIYSTVLTRAFHTLFQGRRLNPESSGWIYLLLISASYFPKRVQNSPFVRLIFWTAVVTYFHVFIIILKNIPKWNCEPKTNESDKW